MKTTVWLGETGIAISVALAAFAAYFPALNGGLLWDDDRHVTSSSLESLHGLWRIWFELGATQQYYPLLHTAFWFEHRMWGEATLGYHLTNVALHATAAIVVMFIVRRLSLPGAALAGLIFALHPVCVESVAWISEQKNTLSAVFYLLAMMVYLGFDQTRRKSSYSLAMLLFVLALLSKSVTATLPVAILIILWWQRGTLKWRKDVLPLIPWFTLAAGAGLLTSWVERRFIGAEGADFALSLGERSLLAPRIVFFYASKLAWPANLTFIYPHWTVNPSLWWQYLFPLAILIVAGSLAVLARKNRGPLAGFLFFIVTLGPALGFVNVYPFVYSYVADHFDYLAAFGIIVPVAVAISRLPALGVGLAAVLGILTWHQASIYVDSETLYRDTLARNPECWLVQNNLGALLMEKAGGLPEAIQLLEASARLRPAYPQAYNNLGMALSRVPARRSEAIGAFETAVRLQPGYLQARNNLGVALLRADRIPEAISQFREALRVDPAYAEAHNNLGNALRGEEAVVEYRAALQLDPNYAEAHYDLANTLSDMPGRSEEALSEYTAALRARPDYPEAHNNFGLLLSRSPKRLPEAIREFRAAIQLQPNFAEAHFNLATALANSPGGLPEAMAEYQTTLQIRPDFALARQMVDRLRASQR